jgi:hypothetical protein
MDIWYSVGRDVEGPRECAEDCEHLIEEFPESDDEAELAAGQLAAYHYAHKSAWTNSDSLTFWFYRDDDPRTKATWRVVVDREFQPEYSVRVVEDLRGD